MFNAPHPGELVRKDCLNPAGLSITDAAKRLDVSRQYLSELINGHNGISATMAWQMQNRDQSASALEAQRKAKTSAKTRRAAKQAAKATVVKRRA